MGQAKHITLYGAAHIDRCGRCFSKPELEKSNPGRFTNHSGGATWNVASGLATLGANVTLHSIIGNDESGQFLVNAASERSFEFDPQISTDKPTATYTSIHSPNGELLIALADMEIYEELDAEEISNEGWILVDTNLPAAAILKITGTGNNKTAAMTVSAAKAPKLQPALTMIDILFTNRAELAALCSEDIEFGLPELISKFQKLGGKSAVTCTQFSMVGSELKSQTAGPSSGQPQ